MTDSVTPAKPVVAAFVPGSFSLPVGFSVKELHAIMINATDLKVSDIKFQSGDFVFGFYRRQWFKLNNRQLDDSEVGIVLKCLTNGAAIGVLGSGMPYDSAPEFFRTTEDRVRCRFRLNAVSSRVGRTAQGVSITLRAIDAELPVLSKLGLPAALLAEILPKKGMVLMSGPTGSGKTTTIAGCLQERTQEIPAPCILTYESPIEFPFDLSGLGNGPLVSQIEIGVNLKSWSQAAETAMRRKADVILMGEVRNPEQADATIEMAITGHMVYATLHADTPQETVFRVVEMFPAEVRSSAASKFLSSLRLLVSQKLIKTKSGDVVPLHSWLAFDHKMKETLQTAEYPYHRWAAFVKEQVEVRGQDFATQCIPLIVSGEIDVLIFKEIAQMTLDEAQEFIDRVMKSTAPPAEELELA